jgi:hypothetical protein
VYSYIDGVEMQRTTFDPHSDWANPFAPEFQRETTYLSSNMPGSSTSPTQFRSLQAQDDATGVLGPMPCGMIYDNDQSTLHYTPFTWTKTDHSCQSFDVWNQ